MAEITGGAGSVFSGILGIVAGLALFGIGLSESMDDLRAKGGTRIVEAQRISDEGQLTGASGTRCAFRFLARGKAFTIWADRCSEETVAVQYLTSDPDKSSIVSNRPLPAKGTVYALLGLGTVGLGLYLMRGDVLPWANVRRP